MAIALPQAALADAGSDAAVLHARALLSEDDGDKSAAVDLLRKAHTADPTSELIAYDLARLAMETGSSNDADLIPLVTLPLHFEASRRLKVYALIALGRAAEAEDALAATRFEPSEAQELRELFDDVKPSVLALDASFGAERDTNVTLLPDSEGSHDGGTRLVLDTTVAYRPTRIFELGLIGQLGRHLDDRDVLADYDYGIASLLATLGGEVGPLEITADFTGTVVTSSLVAELFSDDVSSRVDVQLAHVPLRPGLYGRAGVRNYVAGNLESTIFDRDATLLGAGIVSNDSFGRVSYLLRAGLLLEDAQGDQQRQRGYEGSAFVRYHLHALSAGAGASLTRRSYIDSTTDRLDTRFAPSLDASYDFTRHVGLNAGYSYTHNGSNADNFRYGRHIFRLMLAGSF